MLGNNTAPKISVVVATYNAHSTLQRCIDSVVSQKYQDVELIVIDGASTDGTVGILEKNSASISYWVSEPDRGITHAWNKALAHIHGDWVLFLGADDLLIDDMVFSDFVAYLENPSCLSKLMYGQVMMVDNNLNCIGLAGWEWRDSRNRFLCVGNNIPHQGVFHHVSLFDRNIFNEDFKIAADYDLMLRTVLSGVEPIFMKGLIITQMQAGGISNDKRSRFNVYKEFAKVRERNGLRKYTVLYIFLLVRAWVLRMVTPK